jgi:hypothetical protein
MKDIFIGKIETIEDIDNFLFNKVKTLCDFHNFKKDRNIISLDDGIKENLHNLKIYHRSRTNEDLFINKSNIQISDIEYTRCFRFKYIHEVLHNSELNLNFKEYESNFNKSDYRFLFENKDYVSGWFIKNMVMLNLQLAIIMSYLHEDYLYSCIEFIIGLNRLLICFYFI